VLVQNIQRIELPLAQQTGELIRVDQSSQVLFNRKPTTTRMLIAAAAVGIVAVVVDIAAALVIIRLV